MNVLFRSFLILLFAIPTQVAATGPNASYRLAFSDGNTNTVVNILEAGISQCQALDAAYRFDCYRQNYRSAASKLNGKPDYRDAQQALRQVEKTLKAIIRQYGDKAAPTIRVAGKTYKAVAPDAIQTAATAFSRARAEAETVLLRASGHAELHYARIAAVVGSDKLIIRS